MSPRWPAAAAFIALLILGMFSSEALASANTGVRLVYNGRSVESGRAIVKANRLLVPLFHENVVSEDLRSIFDDMGASPTYDPATHTVDIYRPDVHVQMVAGVHEISVNGIRSRLDVAAEIHGSTVFVPIRVLCEVLGARVFRNPRPAAVSIGYRPAPDPTPPPPPDVTPSSAPVVPWTPSR